MWYTRALGMHWARPRRWSIPRPSWQPMHTVRHRPATRAMVNLLPMKPRAVAKMAEEETETGCGARRMATVLHRVLTAQTAEPSPAGLLRTLGLRAKHDLSQNFLLGTGINRALVRRSLHPRQMRRLDCVVEIGTGPTGLTRAILAAPFCADRALQQQQARHAQVGRVVAPVTVVGVELDTRFVPVSLSLQRAVGVASAVLSDQMSVVDGAGDIMPAAPVRRFAPFGGDVMKTNIQSLLEAHSPALRQAQNDASSEKSDGNGQWTNRFSDYWALLKDALPIQYKEERVQGDVAIDDALHHVKEAERRKVVNHVLSMPAKALWREEDDGGATDAGSYARGAAPAVVRDQVADIVDWLQQRVFDGDADVDASEVMMEDTREAHGAEAEAEEDAFRTRIRALSPGYRSCIREGLFMRRFLEETPAALIGNLPFSVATALFAQLTSLGVGRTVPMALMFQKEVADRLTAAPGTKTFSRLTLLAQNYYHVHRVMDLAPNVFVPAPKVSATMLLFVPRSISRVNDGVRVRRHQRRHPVDDVPIETFMSFTALLYSGRRKQLKRVLKAHFCASRPANPNVTTSVTAARGRMGKLLRKLEDGCGIDVMQRAYEIDVVRCTMMYHAIMDFVRENHGNLRLSRAFERFL